MTGDEARNKAVRPLAGILLYALTGPIVWAAHLAIIYSAHVVSCALGGAPGLASLIVIVTTIIALITLFLAVSRARAWRRELMKRSPADGEHASAVSFIDGAMALLVLLSAVGVAWAGAMALMLEPCQPLR